VSNVIFDNWIAYLQFYEYLEVLEGSFQLVSILHILIGVNVYI